MNSEKLDQTKQSLADWEDTWNQALESGIFDDSSKPREQESIKLDRQTYEMAGLEPQLLQEDKTPNPVYPDSVGKDQEQPKPVWVTEDMLKEIEGLKNKLFELENKFAKNSGEFIDQAAGDKKVMSQIESIRSEIDKLSSSLGIEEEPSPWETEDK